MKKQAAKPANPDRAMSDDGLAMLDVTTAKLLAKMPLSLRMTAGLRKKLDEVQALYVRTAPEGPAKDVTQAEIVRWALEEGLAVIKQRLTKKAGAK
jgi:hypothetical protein